MKSKINRIKIVGLLSLTLLCGGLHSGILTTAQEMRRERTSEKPTPTPKQTPTPKPTAAPTIIPTPTPTPIPLQTVADLQAKIRAITARSELRRGQIGTKIVSLETNKTIYEENAEKYFMPASNMKSYTVAAGLEKLSPDFRFTTSVFAPTMPDANGTIRGDVSVFGRGDVSFSAGFYDGDFFKGLNALADKIAQSGVKRIEGNIVGDESYFSGNTIPASWEWDDLQWKSGAEISALPVNDNLIELNIKPSAVNSPCYIQTLPTNTIMKIVNRCQTSPAGTERGIQVTKKLDQNILEIGGTMPVGDKGYKGGVTVSRPAQLFVELLRGILLQKGVTITGQNKVINASEKYVSAVVSSIPQIEIAKLESPPFSVIAAKTMKPSQNTYTEIILWTLGEQIGRKQAADLATDEISLAKLRKTSSAELGANAVRNFLTEIGIAPDSVVQWDGSGLSRHNLITPNSAVALYTYMSKSRYANVWRDSLTVGGVDGTLQNRFKGTIAADNVRGKTGTIDQVSTLSGYVTTAAGERLVFSILVNGVNDGRLRQAVIDEIVVALANFNGKTL
ncbi:MAG: D-alanyl-D-alanine carboxypeptidase/D-alanyl-D-alanine-endopeptidase [Pyrinomonadaceae bacterium]|nr:D-alanyl-D-alanine carboxypeptidase/D-alanyl-D-alanine-endopeptidase [Pyrinomonadaceae bacterium]